MTPQRWPNTNRSRLEAVFQSDAYLSEFGAKLVEWGVALTVEAQFLSAPLAGDVLVATALERSRTRRTASYAIDVISEEDGTLRAGFQAMTFRTGRWHLGEDAWPEEWRAAY